MIGQVFGKYQITGLIGAGGMGKVYKAVDTKLQREVAIKVLSSRVVEDPNVLERFRAEAKTLARLSHPNIASVFDLDESQGEYLLVMELVDGETLEEMVQRDGPLSPKQASELICQALQGLEHAHAKGIVHRDIKPANLMVTPEGVVKLMDFGIAKAQEGPKLTREGKAPGTPEYMSPEQIQGLPLDPRSDLYSMGVVLFELLSGDVPFHGDTDFELMRAHVDIQPPSLKLPSGAGMELDRIIQKALSKNVARRYASALEMRSDLLKVAQMPEASGFAATLASFWRRSLWQLRNSPQVAFAVFGLALALVLVGLFVPGVRIGAGAGAVVVAAFGLMICGKSHWLGFPLGLAGAVFGGLVIAFGFISAPAAAHPAHIPGSKVAAKGPLKPASADAGGDANLVQQAQLEQQASALQQQQDQVNAQAAQNQQTAAQNQLKDLIQKADDACTAANTMADNYHFSHSGEDRAKDKSAAIAKAQQGINLGNQAVSQLMQGIQVSADDQGKLYSDMAVMSWFCDEPFGDFVSKAKSVLPDISDSVVKSQVNTNVANLARILNAEQSGRKISAW